MFYAAFKNPNKEHAEEWIYYSWDEYNKDTFNPDCEKIALVEFRTHGKTYAERKQNLEDIAKEFLWAVADSGASPSLSYGEWNTVSTWFENVGRRYGLLSEFRENGVC